MAFAAAVVVLAGTVPAQSAGAAPTKYSIAGGCYALDGPGAGRSDAFRMQATDLATYLLYDGQRKFLAAAGGGTERADEPSRAAEWRAIEAGGSRLGFKNLATGDPLVLGSADAFDLVRVGGCPHYPEITVDTSGRPRGGASPFAETRGFWDPHMHLMAFEAFGGGFHCGRPWHRYGVPYALPDCSYLEGRTGASVAENYLNWGTPVHAHDTAGWPTFKDWPTYHSFTYEQTYYKWIERAWRGGLRLGVNLFVDNRSYCDVLAQPQNRIHPCDEMETVRREAKDIYEMQDYIDAQFGGPGKGFFRIVTNPFEARRVINDGKLAVVLGIEVSELFDCTPRAGAVCDRAHVDRSLDEVYKLGVRDLELLNKYDNAFVGVRFDSGTFGTFVNLGNYYTAGHFWKVKRCAGREADNPIAVASVDVLFDLGIGSLVPPGGLPVYPNAPHCNVLGMTPLGEYLVNEMIDRGMIIDPDHMSVDAANRTLAIARARKYSGLVSSHSWTDEHNWPDIYELGGVVAPQGDDSDDFVETWRKARRMRDPDYLFGFGFGDDMGGFSAAGSPREGAKNPVRYPFKSFDGRVTLRRQQSGTQTFDINEDGVAHFGLFPDWVEDLRRQAGSQIVADLARGSEAYLQMWERAVGVPHGRCLPKRAKLTARGLGKLRIGDSAKQVLRRAGQPDRRAGRTYRYCVGGPKGKGKVTAVFDRRGRLELIRSTAPGHEAGGVEVGDRLGRAASRRARGGVRFVYAAESGRVISVGVRHR
jgi:hypothetical protein